MCDSVTWEILIIVLPSTFKVNYAPPRRNTVLSHTTTHRAIKLLEKYDNTPEPLKPTDFSKTQLKVIKAKIEVPKPRKTEFTWRTKPLLPSDPEEGTSSGIKRKARMCSSRLPK